MSEKKIETVPATEVLPTAPATKQELKTPKVKLRSILELEDANPNSMTQTEAIKYIKYLREENTKLCSKIDALENNIKSAFAKASYFEKAAESIDSVHKKQHAFIESSIRNLLTSLEHISTSTVCNVNAIKKGNN
jgi:hypothetical protein